MIDQIRATVESLGGSVGTPTPMANWIELHGVFTPEQLRTIAAEIENQYGDPKRSDNQLERQP